MLPQYLGFGQAAEKAYDTPDDGEHDRVPEITGEKINDRPWNQDGTRAQDRNKVQNRKQQRQQNAVWLPGNKKSCQKDKEYSYRQSKLSPDIAAEGHARRLADLGEKRI
ncbi:hypothetical protein SDC9_84080 [bioreactor metagenome]|uniref:Uncharacterized protein n=1 Tax=bioreactor metagenome TaxID=1076179 RepID=A0A644ZFH7_9ZZZZ